MYSRDVLMDWLVEALEDRGGEAHLVQVAESVWERHEEDLRRSGALFFTWQYDLRWAALKLRKRGVLRAVDDTRKGVWGLA